MGSKTYRTVSARSHQESVGTHYRSALRLMTMANSKTPKGEELGYLTAILYLQPHTAGGGRTVCSYSTPACREMCLAGAGLSGLGKQQVAKQRRTDLFHQGASAFAELLLADIDKLIRIAAQEGMKPVVRLNGTSDILWEHTAVPGSLNKSLMDTRPTIQFMDYTKIPLAHRLPPANYHLTYSYDGARPDLLVAYLRHGHSVAVVTALDVKAGLVGLEVDLGSVAAPFVDGDLHDLRFLDAPGSIVLLKPKGHVKTDLIRPNILAEIRQARAAAA